MPTIKDSLHFNFDGKSSQDFGLMHVSLDSGMYEEQLVANREIVETDIEGSDKPLFHKIEESPNSIELILAFKDKFNEELLDEIILWLFQDNYKPLYFEDKPHKIMRCIAVGSPTIVHNGFNEGYITVEMRLDSTRIQSNTIETEAYSVTSSQSVNLENKGHVTVYPEISIEKVNDGFVEFRNESNKVLRISNLAHQEKIYIDCEKEIIESDIPGMFRYEDVSGDYDFLKLKKGITRIIINGNCIVKFRYKYKYKF